ncbi:hypothetical protein ASG43_09390 [Aureimonas sp. Leaf454]|uniref:DUF2062 domain-containing protein n=1 Tax=Aureimonas sp. Leaf454 TaxID=1736381 RepID=UPI0006F6DD1B|nr:DUF2062 domain-containing protein [Aureimonas sp. Leaf454]KQT47335.1 hypothetical protein ASG43_09390 [Aureimonas sp. Leaf454]
MRWPPKIAVSKEAILGNRWIRPFAHRLTHPSLWHLNRRSVSRGVALGLVAGFLIPVGQIVVAALLAFSVRANIVVAATATLVTNPLTFPPIYYAAYRVGRFILGTGARELSEDQVFVLAENAASAAEASNWSFVNVLLPLALGLLVFAAVSGVLGFALGRLVWTMRIRRKWRRRITARSRGRKMGAAPTDAR